MPPGLPVKFQNVHYYRVAGHYVFAGDLFIARNNLYFFPEVDLAQEREEVSTVLPHEIALVLVMLFRPAGLLPSEVRKRELEEQHVA